jgi:transcriptional regulator with XRE-family HTH domain
MDYELLSQQLIRALRGRRSQVALSRRLRYDSNVLYTWESGRRAPTAAIFFSLAQKVGIDVAKALGTFLGDVPDTLARRDWSDPATSAAFLAQLREGTTTVELARRMNTNRVSVARWLKGEAEPRLPDFLQLVEATSLRLLDFLAGFVAPDQLAEARTAWLVLEAQRRVAYGLPWSHAVMRALELRDYQKLPAHEPGWLAARLGLSLAEEDQCLEALAGAKLIERRKGRWQVSRVLMVDTRQNPRAGLELKQHWARVGIERLPELEPGGDDLFSYNLFTVSEQGWQRLREMHIAYFRELRRVIESSQPAERVGLLNLQLLRLDECSSTQRRSWSPSKN